MPAGSLSFKSRESLQSLFCPQSVAVIGASTAPEKLGYQIFKNILDAGFPGTVHPINPKATEILGRRCYPSIEAIPDQVDLATIIIPAPFVADTIRQCSKRGVKGAIVISGGFSETGPEGEALQNQLLQAARESNVAVPHAARRGGRRVPERDRGRRPDGLGLSGRAGRLHFRESG